VRIPMTSNSIDAPREYKDICAGIGCRNIPSVCLMIKYVKKSGWFCDDCAQDLLRLELAERLEGKSSDLQGGK
jgi:hypothetical protein